MSEQPVSSMSPEEKVAAALQRSITYLPAEIGDALRSFLEPEALAIMAGTMAVWAASHLLGVGELVKNGYVTISALLGEGAYVGTVLVGGLLFRVRFTKVRPTQLGSP